MPNIVQANLEPHDWWDFGGECGPMLASIANNILRQVCLPSLCEWNRSMCHFVHSKFWNWLTMQRTKDFVYVYTNTRFQHDWMGSNPVAWYANMAFLMAKAENRIRILTYGHQMNPMIRRTTKITMDWHIMLMMGSAMIATIALMAMAMAMPSSRTMVMVGMALVLGPKMSC